MGMLLQIKSNKVSNKFRKATDNILTKRADEEFYDKIVVVKNQSLLRKIQ